VVWVVPFRFVGLYAPRGENLNFNRKPQSRGGTVFPWGCYGRDKVWSWDRVANRESLLGRRPLPSHRPHPTHPASCEDSDIFNGKIQRNPMKNVAKTLRKSIGLGSLGASSQAPT
jgi:hypothetical protein